MSSACCTMLWVDCRLFWLRALDSSAVRTSTGVSGWPVEWMSSTGVLPAGAVSFCVIFWSLKVGYETGIANARVEPLPLRLSQTGRHPRDSRRFRPHNFVHHKTYAVSFCAGFHRNRFLCTTQAPKLPQPIASQLKMDAGAGGVQASLKQLSSAAVDAIKHVVPHPQPDSDVAATRDTAAKAAAPSTPSTSNPNMAATREHLSLLAATVGPLLQH